MPGVNGARFLQETRKFAPDTMRVPLTGDVEGVRDEALNEGDIFCILTKPGLSGTPGRVVDAAVQGRRSRDAEREAPRTLSAEQ